MPGGDRTGPTGMGPMTGRGAGYCGGFGAPGFMNRVFRGGFFGRGRGGGGGGGRGWRNMFYATGLTGWQRAAGWSAPPAAPAAPGAAPQPASAEEELQLLRAQAEANAAALDALRRRIDELSATGGGPAPEGGAG